MQKISLFLIVAGLAIIIAVLLARWRLRNARVDVSPPPAQTRNTYYDEPADYDPLFALDKKPEAWREQDVDPVVAAEPGRLNVWAKASRPPAAVAETLSPPLPQPVASPHLRRAPRVATDPEQVITLNIMAPQAQRFAGGAIAAATALAGLELGTWSIYHYYAKETPGAPPLFSMANMVKPGSFDPDRMHEVNTVGLTLFMVPAGDENDIAAFDILLATARQLASDLGGEVRDARRSVLTRQAIERMREQLNEWRFKVRVAQS